MIIKRYDEGDTGSIDFTSFIDIMQKLIKENEIEEEIYQTYKVFDRDDKGITAKALARIMTQLLSLKYKHGAAVDKNGEEISIPIVEEEDAQALINDLDMDGDGRMCYEEFASILMENNFQQKMNERLLDL